jgi:hypothetical protein
MTKKNLYFFSAIALILVLVVMLIFYNPKFESSPIQIKRYEIASMGIDTNRMKEELLRLYGEFPLFLEGADLDDEHNLSLFFGFATDPRSKELLNDILEKYPNLKQLEKTFGESFARYNRMFDREIIPEIYTYISYLDYDNRVIFTDSALVIAIDMYLGADYEHYNAAAIPMYQRMRLEERFIPVDGMKAVAHHILEHSPQPLSTLLDRMILHGKVAYFLEKTLPNVDMATRFGYTAEQMNWCRKNEKMMWSYLVGERLLYEQDIFRYRTLVLESPTVQAFPGSPGRVGHFLGYRIVKKYMENTGQTMPELFAETNNQKILKESNYRP